MTYAEAIDTFDKAVLRQTGQGDTPPRREPAFSAEEEQAAIQVWHLCRTLLRDAFPVEPEGSQTVVGKELAG